MTFVVVVRAARLSDHCRIAVVGQRAKRSYQPIATFWTQPAQAENGDVGSPGMELRGMADCLPLPPSVHVPQRSSIRVLVVASRALGDNDYDGRKTRPGR